MYNNMSGNIDMENCIALFCIISGTNVFLYSKLFYIQKRFFQLRLIKPTFLIFIQELLYIVYKYIRNATNLPWQTSGFFIKCHSTGCMTNIAKTKCKSTAIIRAKVQRNPYSARRYVTNMGNVMEAMLLIVWFALIMAVRRFVK